MKIQVANIKCGGCEASIKDALKEKGAEDVVFNPDGITIEISGKNIASKEAMANVLKNWGILS